MKPIATAFALLVFAAAVSAAEPKPAVVYQWEYRVLSEEQVIALGKKDLTAGLNQLGDEGWELVTAGAHYIFKRPKDLAQKQAAEIKTRIGIAEADVQVLERARFLGRTDAAQRLHDGEASGDGAGTTDQGGSRPGRGTRSAQEAAGCQPAGEIRSQL